VPSRLSVAQLRQLRDDGGHWLTPPLMRRRGNHLVVRGCSGRCEPMYVAVTATIHHLSVTSPQLASTLIPYLSIGMLGRFLAMKPAVVHPIP
jgi:hypothetical protein